MEIMVAGASSVIGRSLHYDKKQYVDLILNN
jgi:hypothetical protein